MLNPKKYFTHVYLLLGAKSVKRAVILGIVAAFCYSIMVFLVKLISGRTTESMTVFVRFAVSLFWVVSVLGYKRLRGEYFSLKTKHPGLHLLRACSGFVAIFALYIALKYVPLVDANLLAITYTLFIPLYKLHIFGYKNQHEKLAGFGSWFCWDNFYT